jgi:predicted component of type VI protein secretion system
MGLPKIIKVVLLVILTVLATSCLEKVDNLGSLNRDSDKLHWDDKQKGWAYNGALLLPKPSDLPLSLLKQKENSILLRVESPKTLNSFDNAPKALQMKIFQLSDAKAFLHAAKSSTGLKHLLVTEQIDPAILGMERLFVLPGIGQSLSLTRLEGTRYIGIVLGYASLKQEKIFRLIPILALDDNNEIAKAPEIASSLTSSFISSPNKPANKSLNISGRPADLKINLFLEANGIDKLDVVAK